MISTSKEAVKEIYKCVSEGKKTELLQIFEDYPELINKTITGNSWLHQAAGKNQVEVIKLLLQKGIEVNRPRTSNQETPLHSAAGNGALEAARLLIERGAIIEAKGEKNSEPLIDAVYSGSLDMVKLLVENGADVNSRYGGTKKRNALDFARVQGEKEIEEYLLSVGAEPCSNE